MPELEGRMFIRLSLTIYTSNYIVYITKEGICWLYGMSIFSVCFRHLRLCNIQFSLSSVCGRVIDPVGFPFNQFKLYQFVRYVSLSLQLQSCFYFCISNAILDFSCFLINIWRFLVPKSVFSHWSKLFSRTQFSVNPASNPFATRCCFSFSES